MSLIERDSTQKVLNIEGLNYLLKKLKSSHMDKIATDSVLGHVKIGPTVTPTSINGEGIAAPSYHTHPAQTEISGNAGTATKLKTPVNIALSGQVNGNADFDGSKNITIKTTIDNSGKTITGVTSLDKLQPGDYIESGGSKYTDSPLGSTSTGKFIIQVVGTDAEKTQIFTDPTTSKVYYRIIENGVAEDWYEILVKKNGNIDGNATSTDKFKTARTIAIIGDADGSTKFDGSKDVDIDITLSDTGVDAGTYGSNAQSNFNSTNELTIPVYTVDGAGRITSSSNQTIKIPKSSGSSTGGDTGGGINPVTIALAGDVTGSKVFDGTTDITIDTTLKNSGATAGSYGETTDITLATGSSFKVPNFNITAKGIISSASTVTVSVPSTFGDEVKSSPTASGKIYLSGKTTSTESTSNDVHNSGLYYDVDSKTLTAPNISGNFTGSASSAKKLTAAVNIGLTGDTTGTTSFDGSKSVNIATTLANSGVTAGSYGLASNTTVEGDTTFNIPKVDVDNKGRVTSATNSTVTIPESSLNKVKSTTANSGLIYITGKPSSEDSTSTEILSPNLYYDVTNNTFHAGKIAATIEGVSESADKLSTARNINLSGDATGTTSFDGSKDVTIATTLKDSGAKAGTYGNTADVSLDTATSFVVPKFTLTSKGIISSSETTTVSLPAGGFTKVKSSPASTGKIYLSGKTTPDESTSTDVHNSGLYYDTETKTLVAPNISGTVGNSSTANKLSAARNISLSGDATGTTSFDGSKNVDIATTLSDSGVIAGDYGTKTDTVLSLSNSFNIPQVKIDAKGRITSAKNTAITLSADAINQVKATPATSGYIYITGKPGSTENTSTDILSPNLYYDIDTNTFHAGKIAATIEGVSETANKLSAARNINLAGDATGTTAFDGSKDVTINTILKDSGAKAGTYGNDTNITLDGGVSFNVPKITITAKGIVTASETTTVSLSAGNLNKVKSSPVSSGKIYLSGKTSTTESTSTDVHNSSLYYDADSNTLVAPNISGNATTAGAAEKLVTPRNISLTGDATGSASFDGSADATISTILANSGVTADTYGINTQATVTSSKQVVIPKVVVDAKGRVTSASNQTISLPTDATTAAKLASPMKLSATGDATGSVSFDGSAAASMALTLANSGVTAGKYGQQLTAALGTDASVTIPYITVDAKGRVTSIKNTTFNTPTDSFNKVKTDIVDDGYIFISGKNELVAGDGTDVINSDLYYDVKNKILHAGKIAGNIEGVSDSANRLAKAVNINLVGAVTGSQAFDGSTSIDITTTIDTVTNEEIDAMMAD